MFRTAAFSLAFIHWAGSLFAQSLPVYTGEHGDFTRVVVGLPDGATWAISPESGSARYVLSFAGADPGFDLSTFWRRIDRSRIAAVAEGKPPRDLVFDLACRCRIRAKEDGKGHLILDVIESEIDAADPLLLPVDGIPNPVPLARRPRNSAAETIAGNLAPDAGADEPSVTSPFKGAILEQFASAISAGVLTASDPEAADRLLSESAPPAPPVREDDLHARDRGGIDCRAFDFLDIRRKVDSPPSLAKAADLRLDLIDGGDQFDPLVVRQLIETYLALGLGQETMPLLAVYSGPGAADLLRLARLVEDGQSGSSAFADRTACGRGGHVWAAFAPDVDPSLIDADAVLASFDVWPDPLRSRLGVPLARVLREHGLASAAKRVLERLQRRPDEVTDAIRLEALRLDDRVRQRDVAEFSASSDDEVVVRAVETMARRPESPEDASELADLTETLVREYRGSDKEPDLRSAHVAALVSAGEYERAFAALTGSADLAGDDPDGLLPKIVAAALEDADDARALSFLIDRAAELANREGLSDSVKLAVADRLTDAQLTDAAMTLLRAVANPRLVRERRLIEARAALANRQPETAEIALIGLQGDAADGLRRQARAMMGDFAYLDARPGQDMPPGQRQEEAILAGNWSGLPEDAATEWVSIADLVAAAPRPLDPEDLGAFEALADDAGAARSSLEALLRETVLTDN